VQNTKVVNAMKSLQDLDDINLHLDELQESANKHTELVRKLEETRKQYLADTKKTEAILKQIEEAERQLARSEAAVTNARKNHQLQIDATADALDNAKSQLLRVEKDRREGMARVEAGEQEVRALEAEIEKERLKNESERNRILQEYKNVEAAFLARNEKRMNALNI
jgi:chromosome segregation ATPase